MSKINILSMKRTKLCSNEAVKLTVSLPSLFSLCVKGIPLSPIVRLFERRTDEELELNLF